MATAVELRLQSRNDRLEIVRAKHEALLAERGEGNLSDTDESQIEAWRSEQTDLAKEIKGLLDDKQAHDDAVEVSRQIHKATRDGLGIGDGSEDGQVYRSMAEYARDVILTRGSPNCSKIAAQFGDNKSIESAAARLDLLKRTPANTLSSNVAGLTPAQHINQIFQVIDKSRPLVSSAGVSALVRGTLTYPRVDTKPVVAVQASQKTEAGNTGLAVSMQTVTASTYLGGGDLSWQAINWSTPDALQLWFDIAAADYALKTEQDAAQTMQHSAFDYNIASTIGATPTFAQFMTAIGAGYSEVFANSKRTANTLYIAPDLYGYLLGLTSDAFSQFTQVSSGSVGPLNVVVSRGMDAGVAVVGDSAGLLVAETPGAPVELRVVEPAIGGVEVGLIGAFASVVADAGAFAMITTAS